MYVQSAFVDLARRNRKRGELTEPALRVDCSLGLVHPPSQNAVVTTATLILAICFVSLHAPPQKKLPGL
jgi:hypothetical protein